MASKFEDASSPRYTLMANLSRIQELVPAQPVEEGSPIKKPKTSRYPSLKGTDPKFRRNHKHALHGTMKALKAAREESA
ncbi:60S ribosomal protein L29 [Pseudogymnoascus destructans]|uniref:60S ribosomal protein L29 n=2 Tax=Pseudogymnoascus TaxID=78156 RepID=A0A2P2SW31_9PEZI|nr:60S ribosomal protein L29 [Pseudogymnoascus verrucosus]XP_024323294.1 60S ribosomal protein L29 [Pseudogymnoascus destructans]OAF58008.1 60S ribosomal protein L29 [Pseudogymnoascus destructans]OBU01052.1 60S ribosomal protein L29 [Pseudogymnoascus verrucosus]